MKIPPALKRSCRKLTAILLGVISLSVAAIEPEDGQKILDDIDLSMNFEGSDFSAIMTMISEDPESGIEKRVIQQHRRDREDKFLMVFQEPATQKGQGYLRVDDNLWFYDPESRKFSHTSMKEQFAGSDANNSDFGASAKAEDYRVVSISEAKLGKFNVYIMDLEGVHNEVTYPKLKIWVTVDTNLVLKSEDYSANARLMRTSFFPSYAKAGAKYIPTKMIFVDNLIEGKKTQITLTDISLNTLPDSLFTKAYVERVNR
jgi:outer membrane lipoprotein-sorting protein